MMYIFRVYIFLTRNFQGFLKDLICLLKESKVFFFPLKDLQEFFDDLVCFLIEPSEFLRFGIHVLYGMEKSGLGKEIYREREREKRYD